MGFRDRLQHAWNAFTYSRDHPTYGYNPGGNTSFYRPDRVRFTGGNERSIVTAVYNTIAVDAAAITIEHAQLDEDGRYTKTLNTGLNDCFNLSANLDQTGRAFKQDIYMSLLDEGCIAIVPVETDLNPNDTSSYDITSMRTGKILDWKPDSVTVRLYNEKTGNREDVTLPKKTVAIVENPLYAVINEKNSTMQRLVRKLNILDAIDEQSGSGKLDLIIQLPYAVRSEAQKTRAEDRRKSVEDQLAGSKYGIAYADATERITQLNRPVENNLMKQIEYLTSMLYSQLGITQGILDGTADEKTMMNYYSRTIEPIVAAVVDEMKRKFLTKTARTQLKSIVYFRDPFKLVPVTQLADIADTFTRNEILSSNEVRQIIGRKPSKDPKADQLVNSNLNQSSDGTGTPHQPEEDPPTETVGDYEIN